MKYNDLMFILYFITTLVGRVVVRIVSQMFMVVVGCWGGGAGRERCGNG